MTEPARQHRSLLLVVSTNPELSPRPAEAVRIAAGVSAWQNVRVHLWLRGEAIRMLDEDHPAFMDEEHIDRHLESLAPQVTLLVDAAGLLPKSPSRVPFQTASEAELARLAAGMTTVIQF
jgi:hypothetical protein